MTLLDERYNERDESLNVGSGREAKAGKDVRCAKVRHVFAILISLVALFLHFYLNQSPEEKQSAATQLPVEEKYDAAENERHSIPGPYSKEDLQNMAKDSKTMFEFAFQGYMDNAFPKDDLRPISCRGSESHGNIALTLLDALDSLVIFNNTESFRKSIQWICQKPTLFDVDARVHVFEVTIRALGGLLSGHTLASRDPTLMPGYNGCLLEAAIDLADRLVPAFDTPTGIPTSWINLRYGHIKGDTRTTCTACAGTLLLEFGTLSRMSGNNTYETLSWRSIEELWKRRSHRNLLGNTINVDTGKWIRKDSGIGAGIDSFYEYLLKSWIAFGNDRYLEIFSEAYGAAQSQMALSKSVNGVSFLVNIHMTTGRVLNAFISSLSAFWPGLQALAGQGDESLALLSDWAAAWYRFGATPEMLHAGLQQIHPVMRGYPLRPEIAESAFIVHALTKDPNAMVISHRIMSHLQSKTLVECGFASIADVESNRLEDTMESFFLSETLKYLYLMFSNSSEILDWYILSTEGHLLPVFPAETHNVSVSNSGFHNGSSGIGTSPAAKTLKLEMEDDPNETSWCKHLCTGIREFAGDERTVDKELLPISLKDDFQISANKMNSILPQIPLVHSDVFLIRQRRCHACLTTSRTTSVAQERANMLWRAASDLVTHFGSVNAGMPNVAPIQWGLQAWKSSPPLFILICFVVPDPKDTSNYQCSTIQNVHPSGMTSQAYQLLPANTLIFSVRKSLKESEILGVQMAEVRNLHNESCLSKKQNSEEMEAGVIAMQAEFGPVLLPGCNSSDEWTVKNAWKSWEYESSLWSAISVEEEKDEYDDPDDVVRARIAAIAADLQKKDAEDPTVLDHEMQSDASEYNNIKNHVSDEITLTVERTCYSDSCNEKSNVPLNDLDGDLSENVENNDDIDHSKVGFTDTMAAICDVEGPPILLQPADGCINEDGSLENAEVVDGSVAVILRDGCSFQDKVLAAERAGAVGAIIVNTLSNELFVMAGNPDSKEPSIPSVIIREQDLNTTLSAERVKLWVPTKRRQNILAKNYLEDLRRTQQKNTMDKVIFMNKDTGESGEKGRVEDNLHRDVALDDAENQIDQLKGNSDSKESAGKNDHKSFNSQNGHANDKSYFEGSQQHHDYGEHLQIDMILPMASLNFMPNYMHTVLHSEEIMRRIQNSVLERIRDMI